MSGSSAAFFETPHRYLTRMRIERAKELLANGDASVTEICMDNGMRWLTVMPPGRPDMELVLAHPTHPAGRLTSIPSAAVADGRIPRPATLSEFAARGIITLRHRSPRPPKTLHAMPYDNHSE
ncbi:MAG: hypothetical protein ACLQMF_13470 [Rectinemataceae bacterium]